MTRQWFQIDEVTGNIESWGRSSADALPSSPSGKSLVLASDADIAQYESMRRELLNDGRSGALRLIDGALTAPADNRLRVRIEVDKNLAEVGIDSIAFTITAIDKTGAALTGFNKRIPYTMPDGRIFAFDFVSGVAQRTIEITRSGRYVLRSNADVAIESPVEILAIE